MCIAYQSCAQAPSVAILRQGKLSRTECRGRRPRRPAPLGVSTAISFVLSAQCCSAQILDNLNLVTSSGTSRAPSPTVRWENFYGY